MLFRSRISLILTLNELSIFDCNQLLENLGGKFSSLEKFKLLSIMGGIPRYLEEISPRLSADENIRQLCFTPSGILVHEFNDIFTDIFSRRSNTYKQIVKLLSSGTAEAKDISNKLTLSTGSYLSECLEDLRSAGIISRHHTWAIKSSKESSLSRYRLKDKIGRAHV